MPELECYVNKYFLFLFFFFLKTAKIVSFSRKKDRSRQTVSKSIYSDQANSIKPFSF